jgi:predicted transcriptional regulator|tara:strand:+ start:621 stop:1031 length:411 start_codon:yes stop_codon:yes gene_type:complete
MNYSDTLYFKKDSIIEIILGSHRTNRLIQNELIIVTKSSKLTPNEFLTLIEIKKGFKKKIDISNKLIIKRQNMNLIFKTLEDKKIIEIIDKKTQITKKGNEILEKTTNKIKDKIIILFKNIDPKKMSGFINIVENL